MPSNINLVYILGPGHCGSTLLNLLLNAHDDVLGLSEVALIKNKLDKDEDSDLLNRPFWSEVAKCYEAKAAKSFTDLDMEPPTRSFLRLLRMRRELRREISGWARDNELLLKSISEVSGTDVLVDASKSWQRLYVLTFSESIDLKVIHLVRDGRGVVNSYRRKYDLYKGMRKWMTHTLFSSIIRLQFRKSQWLQVHYESLCTEPKKKLRRICSFVGVDFNPYMLKYRQEKDVGISGNRMRQNSDNEIILDERWKSELSKKEISMFNLLGGWLNRLCGYNFIKNEYYEERC